ncbi:glycosyltransferase [soil metagenome]
MLSIVLPAYNEAAGLGELLERIGRALGSSAAYRVVVVDDGSTDGTGTVAEAASSRLPVVVIRHTANRGYGSAMRTGLSAAAAMGDFVFTMDADDSHDPSLIPVMLEELRSGYDVVIASRFQTTGRQIGVPWHRRALSRAAGSVFRFFHPMNGVRDYTSGYRGYSSHLIRELIEAYGEDRFIEEEGFATGLELLLKARAVGARASEVPLVLRYDRKQSASKMKIAATTRRALSVLVRQSLGASARRPPIPSAREHRSAVSSP